MKLIDIIKSLFLNKEEEVLAEEEEELKTPEYIEYKNKLNQIKKEIDMCKKFLQEAQQSLKEMPKNSFTEKSQEYIKRQEDVLRWEYTVDEKQLAIKFIRPNLQEDIEYRNYQADYFPYKIQEVISPRLDLRFHGTPIYFAEKIIKEGKISSSADRYDGYIKSTDMLGEISASNVKTLNRTIDYFSDIVAYTRCLPCGCIFVLFPKDEKDAAMGNDILQSVNFRANPHQLYGIVTTPENIEMVKKWMKKSKFNPEIVYTFDEFIQVVEKDSKKIKAQEKTIVEKIDVPSNHGFVKKDTSKPHILDKNDKGRID